jgi:hypothetical protein
MKKTKKPLADDELRPEYKASDFPAGFVRGKYVKRLQENSNVVVFEPEVAELFPNAASVNAALRALVEIAKRTTPARRRSRRAPGGTTATCECYLPSAVSLPYDHITRPSKPCMLA